MIADINEDVRTIVIATICILSDDFLQIMLNLYLASYVDTTIRNYQK